MLDLRRALHAEPGSAEALRLAALRAEDVSAPRDPSHHTFDAVMHPALRTHPTVHAPSYITRLSVRLLHTTCFGAFETRLAIVTGLWA